MEVQEGVKDHARGIYGEKEYGPGLGAKFEQNNAVGDGSESINKKVVIWGTLKILPLNGFLRERP